MKDPLMFERHRIISLARDRTVRGITPTYPNEKQRIAMVAVHDAMKHLIAAIESGEPAQSHPWDFPEDFPDEASMLAWGKACRELWEKQGEAYRATVGVAKE